MARDRGRGVVAATIVFGLAFGWVEAVVVVYLRHLIYPEGFEFPLRLAPEIGPIEVLREAATIVMLLAVAFAGARTAWGRFGLFSVAFGTWDIAYYVGLRLVAGWPASLADWDVLFLIPAIWTGPVWSPVLVAALLTVCGAVLFLRGERGGLPRAAPRHWMMAVGSFVAIVAAFLANHSRVYHGGTPRDFPVVVFLSGVAVGLVAFADVVRAGARQTGDNVAPASPSRETP